MRIGRVEVAILAAAGVAAGGFGYWWTTRRPPLPARTLRIGYQHNPPYQVQHAGGPPTGLAVETVAEAARRARLDFEWTLVPAGPDRALQTAAVDLWPLITIRPERRGKLYISAPWLQTDHVLVLRDRLPLPGPDFSGRVSIVALPIFVRYVHERYPKAQTVEFVEAHEALSHLCEGRAEAAFLEARLALASLRDRPTSCEGVDLQAHVLPGSQQLGVGASFAAAAAADLIRDEISNMADDGSLAVILARHSFFGLNDARATYELLAAQERNRNLLLVIAALLAALLLVLWVTWSLTAARRATERARGDLERVVGELEGRNAELERFLYTVSHDLRSPLITMLGFLDPIEAAAAAGNPEQVRRDAQRIRGAAQRMDRALKELIELNRVGRVANEPETVSFGDLAREASSLVEGRLNKHGVRLEIQEDLPFVRGDRQRLVEVLQNLIDNAAKFAGHGALPRVEVGARQGNGPPVFFVRDNGLGIEPRFHEKVFGLFDRLDPTDDGTGVGLALVKRIVEVHGGRIWIESQGAGSGSTFCFTLPIAASTPTAAPLTPPAASTPRA